MKRLGSVLAAAVLLFCLSASPCLAAKMDADVPVWTEENVRLYLKSYARGQDMDQLYSYYDVQIRRYMPESTFESMLTELHWLTGGFLALGSYSAFAEEERGTMTHVVHLHMEKQDLDAYFTHRNAADDWEVLSLEFVPAEKQEVDLGFVVGASETDLIPYREYEVVIGQGSEYPLPAVITLPAPIPEGGIPTACVLVHDAGPLDRDATIGETHFFRHLARELAAAGVASIRYDKRSFAYPEHQPVDERKETIDDVLLALEAISAHKSTAGCSIVLAGHGAGGILVPTIASKMADKPAGLLLMGTSPASDPEKEHTRLIRELALPTCIVQGRNDPFVSEDEGQSIYADGLKQYAFVSYTCFRGLDHLLAKDSSTDENGRPLYSFDAGIDIPAVRELAAWMLSLVPQEQTMEVEQ